MADIAAIREAIASSMAEITGWQFSPYMLAMPTPPGGHVVPAETDYDLAMGRGTDRHVMLVQVFVADASGDIGQQKALDEYMQGAGARSVKQKLEADQTLGGAAQTVRVPSFTGYRRFVFEGRPALLGVEFRVEVHARGDS